MKFNAQACGIVNLKPMRSSCRPSWGGVSVGVSSSMSTLVTALSLLDDVPSMLVNVPFLPTARSTISCGIVASYTTPPPLPSPFPFHFSCLRWSLVIHRVDSTSLPLVILLSFVPPPFRFHCLKCIYNVETRSWFNLSFTIHSSLSYFSWNYAISSMKTPLESQYVFHVFFFYVLCHWHPWIIVPILTTILPYNMFVKQKHVVLSRCHIFNNMKHWTYLSY